MGKVRCTVHGGGELASMCRHVDDALAGRVEVPPFAQYIVLLLDDGKDQYAFDEYLCDACASASGWSRAPSAQHTASIAELESRVSRAERVGCHRCVGGWLREHVASPPVRIRCTSPVDADADG